MNVDAVQRSPELRDRIEPRLLRPPVESVAPIRDEIAQIPAIRPERPAIAAIILRRLIGEARARKPLAQIGDRGIVDREAERLRTHRDAPVSLTALAKPDRSYLAAA
jgi:hypothetical protein